MVRVMLWWSVYVPALAMVNGLKGRVFILDVDRICVSCGSDGGERVRSHSGRDIGVTIVVCIHSMMFGIPVIGQGGLKSSYQNLPLCRVLPLSFKKTKTKREVATRFLDIRVQIYSNMAWSLMQGNGA